MQVIITYSGIYGFRQDELSPGGCLISDISKMMCESRCLNKYFVSNYMDYSCSISETVRRFTFPYLRRCALLWKLVDSSVPGPSSNMDGQLDASFQVVDNMDESSDLLEQTEVQELEKMFKIPSFDVVIKDENFRHLVQRWLCHFREELEHHRSNWVVHCTPAAPFRLMKLPHLYQDLLRRFVITFSLTGKLVACSSLYILFPPPFCLIYSI